MFANVCSSKKPCCHTKHRNFPALTSALCVCVCSLPMIPTHQCYSAGPGLSIGAWFGQEGMLSFLTTAINTNWKLWLMVVIIFCPLFTDAYLERVHITKLAYTPSSVILLRNFQRAVYIIRANLCALERLATTCFNWSDLKENNIICRVRRLLLFSVYQKNIPLYFDIKKTQKNIRFYFRLASWCCISALLHHSQQKHKMHSSLVRKKSSSQRSTHNHT